MNYKPYHLGLKVYFSATVENGLAHIFDDMRKAVGTDVGMCIGEDGWTGAMLHEDLQDAVGIAAFLATRVEFAVTISSCPTLAKGVVAFGVYPLLGADACQVFLALAHIFSSFYNDGLQAQLDETKSCEQSARPCTDHNDGRTVADITIDIRFEVHQRRFLTDICPHSEIDENHALTGIDTAADDTDSLSLDAILLTKISHDALLIICLLRQNAQI